MTEAIQEQRMSREEMVRILRDGRYCVTANKINYLRPGVNQRAAVEEAGCFAGNEDCVIIQYYPGLDSLDHVSQKARLYDICSEVGWPVKEIGDGGLPVESLKAMRSLLRRMHSRAAEAPR